MSDSLAIPAARKTRKGPRPKHVPIRTCAICRDQATKRALTRVVRQPDGSVVVDETGRMNGRGAYICDKPECRTKAANTDALAKALNVEMSDELKEKFRQISLGANTDDRGETANQNEVN